MKKIILLLITIFLTSAVFAGNNDREKTRTRVITGKILDNEGETIAGAKLVIAETGETFFSDIDGNYKITIPADKDLQITVHTIGFAPSQMQASKLGTFSDLVLKAL